MLALRVSRWIAINSSKFSRVEMLPGYHKLSTTTKLNKWSVSPELHTVSLGFRCGGKALCIASGTIAAFRRR